MRGFSKCFVLKESTTSLGSMEFNIYFLFPFSLTHHYSTVLYEVMKVTHILEHLIKCIFYNHFNIYLSMSPYYVSILRYPLMVFCGMGVWETLHQPDSCYPFNDITCLMKLRSSDRVTQRLKMFWGWLVPNATSSIGGNLFSWAVRSFRPIGHTGNGEVRPWEELLPAHFITLQKARVVPDPRMVRPVCTWVPMIWHLITGKQMLED